MKANSLEFLKKLCENMDKMHTNMFLYTEIWLLSRDKVFIKIFELMDEICTYFITK